MSDLLQLLVNTQTFAVCSENQTFQYRRGKVGSTALLVSGVVHLHSEEQEGIVTKSPHSSQRPTHTVPDSHPDGFPIAWISEVSEPLMAPLLCPVPVPCLPPILHSSASLYLTPPALRG